MSARLFDAGEARPKHGRTRALVALDLSTCPLCGGALEAETIEIDALLRHGGYGATTSSTRLHCSCGWTLLKEVSETRPPRGDDAG